MVGSQLTSEQLGLSGDSQGGAFLGVLERRCKLAQLPKPISVGFVTKRTLKANSSRPAVRPGRG